MLYGIFSDTHANIEALTEVVSSMKDLGAERFVCIGDTVGYGGAPNECCDIVRDITSACILGNHDAAVSGRMDYSYYYEAARNALNYHAEILTAANMEWLKGLPYEVRENGVAFCHGSPIDLEAFDYVFSVEQANYCLPIWKEMEEVTFIGHSHLCKSFALSEDDAFEVVADEFTIREGYKYIISVGSVGQPRDRDTRSSFGLYDTETKKFSFQRVAYNIDKAAKRILDANLDENFANRLFEGI